MPRCLFCYNPILGKPLNKMHYGCAALTSAESLGSLMKIELCDHDPFLMSEAGGRVRVFRKGPKKKKTFTVGKNFALQTCVLLTVEKLKGNSWFFVPESFEIRPENPSKWCSNIMRLSQLSKKFSSHLPTDVIMGIAAFAAGSNPWKMVSACELLSRSVLPCTSVLKVNGKFYDFSVPLVFYLPSMERKWKCGFKDVSIEVVNLQDYLVKEIKLEDYYIYTEKGMVAKDIIRMTGYQGQAVEIHQDGERLDFLCPITEPFATLIKERVYKVKVAMCG